MVENEMNQGVVYDGYTATAQFDASFDPASIEAAGKQSTYGPKKAVDVLVECDPPIVIDQKAKQ